MPHTTSFSLNQEGQLLLNLSSDTLAAYRDAQGEFQNKKASQQLIDALAKVGVKVAVDPSRDGEAIFQMRGRSPGSAIFAGDRQGMGTHQAIFTLDPELDPTDSDVLAKISQALKAPGVLQVEETTMSQITVVTASINPAEFARAGNNLDKLMEAADNDVTQAELVPELTSPQKLLSLAAARKAAEKVKPKTPVHYSPQGEVASPAQTPTIQQGLQEFSQEISTLLGKHWLQEEGPEGLKAFATAKKGNEVVADKARYAIGIIHQLQESFDNPKQFNALVATLAQDKDVMKSLEDAVNSSGDYFHFERRLNNYQEHPLPEAAKAKQR